MGGQSRQAVAAELVLVVAAVEVILLRSIRDAAPAASTGVLLRTLGNCQPVLRWLSWCG
jgi:hypothetical protein